MKKHLFEHLFF